MKENDGGFRAEISVTKGKSQAAMRRACAEGEKLCKTVSLNIKPSKLHGVAQNIRGVKRKRK